MVCRIRPFQNFGGNRLDLSSIGLVHPKCDLPSILTARVAALYFAERSTGYRCTRRHARLSHLPEPRSPSTLAHYLLSLTFGWIWSGGGLHATLSRLAMIIVLAPRLHLA